MDRNKIFSWVKTGIFSSLILVLSACVEIKSDAKISDDAQVSFTTMYDVSKIISAIQSSNKDSADEMAKTFSCEKMNEKLTEEYSCKDLGVGKLSVSGVFKGDVSNGVVMSEKSQLSVDAIQLFKKVADLSPNKDSSEANSDNPTNQIMQNGLVPVAVDQAAQYKQAGMVFALNVQMPSAVLTVNGVEAKDVKDNTVSVNFIDIAGKDSYVITSKSGKNGIWKKILLVLLGIVLLVAAAFYFMKRKKKPESPTPVAPYVAPVPKKDDAEPDHQTEPKAEVVGDAAAVEDNEQLPSESNESRDEGSPDSEEKNSEGKA